MAATVKTWVDNNPPQCAAADLNGFKSENNNLITSTGVATNTADNYQTAVAVASYAAVSTYFTDSGAANAYVLTPLNLGGGGFRTPATYLEGMAVRFFPANTNTGASTVNINGLGVINIVNVDGTPLVGAELIEDRLAEFVYDGTNLVFLYSNLTDQAPWETGDIKARFSTIVPPGWVPFITGSIGDALSGGTIIADATAAALFTYIWTNTIDANCPVSGGRTSAAADFAAHKTITITANDRVLCNYNGTYAIGQVFGEAAHVQTVPEIAGHDHTVFAMFNPGSGPAGSGGSGGNATLTTSTTGGSVAFNVIQPSIAVGFIMKL